MQPVAVLIADNTHDIPIPGLVPGRHSIDIAGDGCFDKDLILRTLGIPAVAEAIAFRGNRHSAVADRTCPTDGGLLGDFQLGHTVGLPYYAAAVGLQKICCPAIEGSGIMDGCVNSQEGTFSDIRRSAFKDDFLQLIAVVENAVSDADAVG